jgi:DNA gyrase/topoisomerase IV subunit B
MDVSSKEPIKNISFNKILIATDSDADGAHLTSMFLGWFKRFGENLFHENKICKLNIPLVLVIDKNEKVIEYSIIIDASDYSGHFRLCSRNGAGS